MALAQTGVRPRALATWRPSPRGVFGVALAVLGVAIVFAVARSQQPRTVDVVRVAREVPAGSFGVADRVGSARAPWLAVLVDRAQEEALANARRSGDLDVALVGPEEQP